jgi:hypothetical protein
VKKEKGLCFKLQAACAFIKDYLVAASANLIQKVYIHTNINSQSKQSFMLLKLLQNIFITFATTDCSESGKKKFCVNKNNVKPQKTGCVNLHMRDLLLQQHECEKGKYSRCIDATWELL